MSTEDQNAMIGKLHLERSSAKRESALLKSQIKEANHLLYGANHALSAHEFGVSDALKNVDALIATGGLDALKIAMERYIELQAKIADLSATLRGAGAE
jgi:hypothetical protein